MAARSAAVLAAFALVGAACDGGSTETSTTTTSVAFSTSTTTTAPATTTTVAPTTTTQPAALDRSDLHVVLVWEFHERLGGADPDELDPAVRRNAARYYSTLGTVLESAPGSVVVTPSPSVLGTLAAVSSGASDEFLDLTTEEPRRLTETQVARLVEALGDIPLDAEDRFPRITEIRAAAAEQRALSIQQIQDLQVLLNLAWIAPELITTPAVAAAAASGRNFDDIDQAVVADAYRDIADHVLDQWRLGLSSGRMEGAGRTQAALPLLGTLSEDDAAVRSDIGRALDEMEEHLGLRPTGLVPSGGAVSAEALVPMGAEGVGWFLTGEAVLAQSLGIEDFRGSGGVPVRAADLYRPWATDAGPVLFAADAVLSDLIAEEYASMATGVAVRDLVDRLRTIAGVVDGPSVVTIVVDGTVPWTHARDAGAAFLAELFHQIADEPGITTVTPSRYLDAFGAPRDRLPDLAAGGLSPLSMWAGELEETRAWDLLEQVRREITAVIDGGASGASGAAEAIRLAESSDWFWFFGDDADSGDDRARDRRFRDALGLAYDRLSVSRPASLGIPIVDEVPAVPDEGTAWTDGEQQIALRWVGEGLEVSITNAASADVWLGGSESAERRSSLEGFPLGFGTVALYRWSSDRPGEARELTVPPPGGTAAAVSGTVSTRRTGSTVSFVVPSDRLAGAVLGDLVQVRAVVGEGDGNPRLLPSAGPAVVPFGVELALDVVDPAGDDHGYGRWEAPRDAVFVPGSFDLRRFTVGVAEETVLIALTLNADLSSSAEAELPLHAFDVAIDVGPGAGTGARTFPRGRVALGGDHGFEALLTIDGTGAALAVGDLLTTDVPLRIHGRARTVVVALPRAALPEGDPRLWGYAVTVAPWNPDDPAGIRAIERDAGQWTGGGAPPNSSFPLVYDVLWHEAGIQEELLADYRPAEGTGDLGPDDFAEVPIVVSG